MKDGSVVSIQSIRSNRGRNCLIPDGKAVSWVLVVPFHLKDCSLPLAVYTASLGPQVWNVTCAPSVKPVCILSQSDVPVLYALTVVPAAALSCLEFVP